MQVTASQDKPYIGISTACTAVSNVTCSGATDIEQDVDDWQDNADTVYTVNVTSPVSHRISSLTRRS
ncbi:hypothetical protein [Actinoplanes sp. NPDC049802]|uniref:hypothetical protein n=1 Tax=Actinoplanes sp. NPDC049802 TaxID=3154742 RepID=UPI0033CC4288